ncbi:hypothetical protein BDM02DRAFT_992609 [Thelephora ganbajun]|uniref:Uncharacterized protein n=1 Tax=Thelephora ganbajun TaxID=370292 RepID=A0ACB6Z3Q7_THEGA|nr:hypothetical protein BDM02DRAFT_992609 [Thelephora ganbajun]
MQKCHAYTLAVFRRLDGEPKMRNYLPVYDRRCISLSSNGQFGMYAGGDFEKSKAHIGHRPARVYQNSRNNTIAVVLLLLFVLTNHISQQLGFLLVTGNITAAQVFFMIFLEFSGRKASHCSSDAPTVQMRTRVWRRGGLHL